MRSFILFLVLLRRHEHGMKIHVQFLMTLQGLVFRFC